MIDYIIKIVPNRWGAFILSVASVAFLLGVFESFCSDSLGGALLSSIIGYVLLTVVIVKHCKRICGISTLAAIGLFVLATTIGSILIFFIEENVYSKLIPYDHPLKHNMFFDWLLPCLGIGLINVLAVYICTSIRTKRSK